MSETVMNEYISKAAAVAAIRARGAQPLACTHTYGCQGNVSDGERINGMLAAMGYGFTDDPQQADLILYNTCAVREHAEDRVFGNVGALKHIKRKHPDTIIALCGCMVQQEHIAQRLYESFPYVSLVFGTHVIHRLPELLYRVLSGGKRVYELSQSDASVHEEMPIRRDGDIKAWLPIMYGCDNFCSYCVVPYVRGRERSRDEQNIVSEFEDILSSGYKDITLLGQNVNSYMRKESGASKFPGLLKRLDEYDGEYWLRFMTSHPKDCSEELLDVMASSKHVARHLHLPFQSGDNEILAQMNRRYTREKYLGLIEAARKRMPDISLTSDVIVGFPGETDAQFRNTLDLIKEVGFTSLFTFIYSKRSGTPAAQMADPISDREKSDRMGELLKLQESIAAERCSAMVGTVQRVLAEKELRDGVLSCRTSGNIIVETQAPRELVGKFIDAKITEAGNWVLKGTV